MNRDVLLPKIHPCLGTAAIRAGAASLDRRLGGYGGYSCSDWFLASDRSVPVSFGRSVGNVKHGRRPNMRFSLTLRVQRGSSTIGNTE
jgi:hypothetical protein